jgi:hypothetical protein
VVHNRKEVIDLPLWTNKISNPVNNWHVSDEPSLLDLRYICFQIGNMVLNQTIFRDPKRTNCESHRDDLEANLDTILHSTRNASWWNNKLREPKLEGY